ncbi:MAG: addiction module antitoxin RelB [Nevskia sp.]|nr:addiction module antitoxin RelB [Nevskia sp.]
MDAATIEQEALHLPLPARAALAHKLLVSLDALSETEAEQLWLDEAKRRAAEIDNGTVQLVPSDEVSRKARALLG